MCESVLTVCECPYIICESPYIMCGSVFTLSVYTMSLTNHVNEASGLTPASTVAPFTLAFGCSFSAPILRLRLSVNLSEAVGVYFCSGADPPLEVVSGLYYRRTKPV